MNSIFYSHVSLAHSFFLVIWGSASRFKVCCTSGITAIVFLFVDLSFFLNTVEDFGMGEGGVTRGK